MNEFFETSKKKSKKHPRGRSVQRGLHALFNLVLVLGVSVAVGIACLYLFVLREYENDLGRTYPELAENSYVYDVDGNKIGEIPVTERRETVDFEGLGAHLPGPSSPSRTGASTITSVSTSKGSPGLPGRI